MPQGTQESWHHQRVIIRWGDLERCSEKSLVIHPRQLLVGVYALWGRVYYMRGIEHCAVGPEVIEG
jgi:hypothetical protein